MNDPVRGELLRTLRLKSAPLFAGCDPLRMGETLLAADLLPDALRDTDLLGMRLADMDAALGAGDPAGVIAAVEAVLAVAPDNARALAVLEGSTDLGLAPETRAAVRRRFSLRHAGLLPAPRNTRCHQLAPLPDGGFAALDAERPALYRFDASGRLLGETTLPLDRTAGLACAADGALILTDPARRAFLFLDRDLSPVRLLDFSGFDGLSGQDWTPYRPFVDAETLYVQALCSRDNRFHILALPLGDRDGRQAPRRIELPQCPFPVDLIPDGNRLWALNFRPGLLCLYDLPGPGDRPVLRRVVCARPSLRAMAVDGEEIFLAGEENLIKRDARGHVYAAPLAAMSPEGKATLTHMLLVRDAGRRVLYLCDKTRRGIRRVEIDPPQ
jgi:hypothetical protein